MGATYAIAFQAQQTPAHFALVAAMAGHPWAPREAMVVADLGCGRGHVAQVLAASNPGWTVFGLDHDAAAIAEARQLAARAGLANANFLETDLAALDGAELDHLPEFDVVMVHGVWSWISDEVRAGILRLLARRLKPGGLAYLGYNVLPAGGEDAGLQRLLRHLAGGEASAEAAAHAMERLRALGGLNLPRTPMLERLLAEPPLLEPGFVAHEFLTPHWRPVFHEDLAAALAPARLEFLGSCNLSEALPALVGTPAQQAALAPLGEAEFAKDLLLPRAFRADLFVRGRRHTDPVRAMDALPLATRLAPPETSPALRAADARAVLPDVAWAPIAEALARGPARLGSLRRLAPEGMVPSPAELLALLVDTGLALPAFRPAALGAAATRFNRAAAAFHAPGGEGRGHFALASPVAAGGVPAGPLDLALVGALLGGADASAPEALLASLNPGLGGGVREAALSRVRERLAEALPGWLRFGVVPPEVLG